VEGLFLLGFFIAPLGLMGHGCFAGLLAGAAAGLLVGQKRAFPPGPPEPEGPFDDDTETTENPDHPPLHIQLLWIGAILALVVFGYWAILLNGGRPR
jgi:hypothetical protein